jgi:uncharacterized protein (TIGR03435 family)
MTRALIAIGMAILLLAAAFGQSTEHKPAFELADVHVSPRSTNTAIRTSARARRYEIHNATLLDLIRTAYTMDAEKILDGPSWIEFDRFDVIALMPSNAAVDAQKLMLQSLLADRFKLVVRNDTKPFPGLVLSPGKNKNKLKEAADPNATPACQTQAIPATPNAAPATPLGPATINLPMTNMTCHNVTMEKFAAELKRLAPAYVSNAILDQTGLKGSWDFDMKFTQRALIAIANTEGASATSLPDAIDRQLGLKLEEQKLPTPVLVVEKADQPTANSPDVAAKLPPARPMEFEVADIKPVDPNRRNTGPNLIGVQPGGRVNLPGIPIKLAILLAWNMTTNPNEQIIGAPKWIDTANFDIVAKVAPELAPATGTTLNLQEMGPALQALLIDRFKMKVHFEDRMVDAYTLVAVKPKLKKADPSTRTGCKSPANNTPILITSSGGLPSRTLNCQNMTMAQFVDQIPIFASTYTTHPVIDKTGLEGAWDFTLNFSPISANVLNGLRGAIPAGTAGATPAATPTASEPIGGGVSFIDAVEKQLGLKLELQKRNYPVFVIDHIEEKPTDN